jgi:diaminopimelate epimerase
MGKNNPIPFYKMSGGGNDFVIFDNRKKILPEDYGELAKKMCERKFSVGADGILILEKEENADFRMVYYNSDGSRAEMCGNGGRCIARFAHLLKIAPQKMKFETDSGPIGAEIIAESVKLNMGAPRDLKMDFNLKLEDGKEFNASFVNTGVPHAVVLVTDLEKTDVQNLGKAIRYHKEFAPAGTNVNFVLHKDDHTLAVRTYERGVEAETLACGTGVTASSLICGVKNLVSSPVSCVTKGGEVLKVYFQIEKASAGIAISEVYLEGPATVSFRGEIVL